MTAGAYRPVHIALFATVAAASVLRRVRAFARLVFASHDLVLSKLSLSVVALLRLAVRVPLAQP